MSSNSRGGKVLSFVLLHRLQTIKDLDFSVTHVDISR